MIHIDRDNHPPALKVFVDKSVKWLDNENKITRAQKELEKAKAFFADPANFHNEKKITDQKFTFRVYKDQELADCLSGIFLGKCAYCESRFAHVTPKEIEHYRPKSEIDNGQEELKPGYYWLAGDWHNLLVSCVDCNRSRKHRVPGQSKKVKLGKGTQFPLEPESVRKRHHDEDLDDEEPARLLLHPCLDQPEEHLTFSDDGLIHSRKDADGVPSARGRVSIDVYALQRKELVEERETKLKALKFQFDLLHDQVDDHAFFVEIDNRERIEKSLVQIRALVQHVKEYFDEKAPYQGMLREWVKRSKAAGEFEDLIEFEIDPVTLFE